MIGNNSILSIKNDKGEYIEVGKVVDFEEPVIGGEIPVDMIRGVNVDKKTVGEISATLITDSAIKSTMEYVQDLYDELEETVLACLAAGVPLNLIGISQPYHNDQRSYHESHQIKAELFFTGRL